MNADQLSQQRAAIAEARADMSMAPFYVRSKLAGWISLWEAAVNACDQQQTNEFRNPQPPEGL